MPTVNGRILAGLQRLTTFQHNSGLFSIWCNGHAEPGITSRVAHRLLGLRGLGYELSDTMLDKAKTALLQAKHRDNSLLPLDKGFGGEMKGAEDAVAYYFVRQVSNLSGQISNLPYSRAEALKFLQQTVKADGSKVYWQAKSAWGGNLEVTADAARTLYHANDPLFRPAFTFVTGKLVNGMLYSTADTRALVELLASLQFDPATRAVIDGQEVTLGENSIGREVTALSDNLIVRVDEEIEINHLEPRADFQFAVQVGRGEAGGKGAGSRQSSLTPLASPLRIGERIRLSITPSEQTIAPLARIFLPGNLATLKGGANAQTAYLPIETAELTVDVVAVRPGKGRLYVSVHDMYDAEKVGTIPGVEIVVSEQ